MKKILYLIPLFLLFLIPKAYALPDCSLVSNATLYDVNSASSVSSISTYKDSELLCNTIHTSYATSDRNHGLGWNIELSTINNGNSFYQLDVFLYSYSDSGSIDIVDSVFRGNSISVGTTNTATLWQNGTTNISNFDYSINYYYDVNYGRTYYVLSYIFKSNVNFNKIFVPFATSALWTGNFDLIGINLINTGQSSLTDTEINNLLTNQSNSLKSDINNIINNTEESINNNIDNMTNSITNELTDCNTNIFAPVVDWKSDEVYYTYRNNNLEWENTGSSIGYIGFDLGVINYDTIYFQWSSTSNEYFEVNVRTDVLSWEIHSGQSLDVSNHKGKHLYINLVLKNKGSGYLHNLMVNTNGFSNTFIPSLQKKCQNKIDSTNDKLDSTNNKLDESIETQKGIWGSIKSIFNILNPFSEDFFAYKLVELILDMLINLIVPQDMSFLDEFRNSLESKLGFIAEVPMQVIN